LAHAVNITFHNRFSSLRTLNLRNLSDVVENQYCPKGDKESLLWIATALLSEQDEKWLAEGKVYLKG